MTTIPHNPFANRSTIKNEHDFVGREQEITNIMSRVHNGDSITGLTTKLKSTCCNGFSPYAKISARY